mmetsp:Transcript_19457/g.35958  ORF Transcript_19457/g.35958 Transcript_19457/m.35958 type:complete len:316 (-) Transcript_19457:290-1237(-)
MRGAPTRMGARDEPCLYSVLGVAPSASSIEIRAAYKRLARRYHPDKLSADARDRQTEPRAPLHRHDMFTLVSGAYEVLNDPTKRFTYDMIYGHKSSELYGELSAMKKHDAEQAVNLMKVSFDIKRRAELARGGLVIDDAVYGPAHLINTCSLEDLALSKSVVNVTRQLQCAVEKSRLVVPRGEAKHHSIPGLYDPAPDQEKLLWVRYYFRGKLHRVIVHDQARLLMPLKSHLADGRLPRQHQLQSRSMQKTHNHGSAISPSQAIRLLITISTVAGVACIFAPALKLGLQATWRSKELLHFAGLNRRQTPALIHSM